MTKELTKTHGRRLSKADKNGPQILRSIFMRRFYTTFGSIASG